MTPMKEEDQEVQLAHAGSERVAQDLQAFGVSGELEDPNTRTRRMI